MDMDAASESKRGDSKIGTTKKGIGPAYAAKANRIGVRFGDLTSPNFDLDFVPKFRNLVQVSTAACPELKVNVDKEIAYYRSIRDRVEPMSCETVSLVGDSLSAGRKVLVEGANAIMIDMDFGTYPYVTSSNPSIGGVCTGLGVPPNKIGNIWGTVKAVG